MRAFDKGTILRHRVALLAIDQATLDVLQRVAPFAETCFSGIIEDFYAHMQHFPEGRRAFADPARVKGLKRHQYAHWVKLFNGELDADYVEEAMRIGIAHERAKVAPHIYLAGYHFFLAALLKRVSTRFQNDPQLPLMCEAVTKIVALDSELALSVYLRELWRHSHEGKAA